MFKVCTGVDFYRSYPATTVNLFACEACGDIPYCDNAYRSKLLSSPEIALRTGDKSQYFSDLPKITELNVI